MILPEDSGLSEDGLLLGLDGMQTMGFTPPGGGGGPSICTFYDTVLTWYIVSNGKVLAEYDGLTKALHYKYIYAGDQRIAMRDGVNRLHYYLNDHLGSARVVIDSAGTIKDKYHYLAFGSPLDMTTSTGQPNKYTGKPYDMDAGMNLYYYGARYYDAELGRFTQVDQLRNKYPEWGAYVYVGDNPHKYFDPDGRDAVPIVFKDYLIDGTYRNLGHAGILLINDKTGLTKYYEYGRYDKEQKGIVRNRKVPNVEIDRKTGLPTAKSLNKVLSAISRQSGQNTDPTAVYIQNNNFQPMVDYAEALLKQADDPNRKPYGKWTNNCGHFVKHVLEAGDVDVPWMIDPRPNSYINELAENYRLLQYEAEKSYRNKFSAENN